MNEIRQFSINNVGFHSLFIEICQQSFLEKKIPRKSLVKKVYTKMDFIEQKILQPRNLRKELYKLLLLIKQLTNFLNY